VRKEELKLKKTAEEYRERVLNLYQQTQLHDIEHIMNLFREATKSGSKIFVVGNGGSCSTASHFVADMTVGNLIRGIDTLQILNPFDNVSSLTAAANDISFISALDLCLNAFSKSGDILFLISASGNSENLVNAAKAAKLKGLKVISLTGFDGGRIKEISEINIHIQTRVGDYGPVEDIHLSICHLIAELWRDGA
jgi:D-sedoheptulose 7-phosphate isomerase